MHILITEPRGSATVILQPPSLLLLKGYASIGVLYQLSFYHHMITVKMVFQHQRYRKLFYHVPGW